MAHVESILIVHQSLEDVFDFLNAAESHLKFIPRMTQLVQTSPGVIGQAGTTISGMLNYFCVRIPVRYEIIEVKPNHRLAMKGWMGPILFTDGYILAKKGSRTEIKFWLELVPTGWSKVLTPFMGLIGKSHAWETLRNLKREITRHKITSSLRSSQ